MKASVTLSINVSKSLEVSLKRYGQTTQPGLHPVQQTKTTSVTYSGYDHQHRGKRRQRSHSGLPGRPHANSRERQRTVEPDPDGLLPRLGSGVNVGWE